MATTITSQHEASTTLDRPLAAFGSDLWHRSAPKAVLSAYPPGKVGPGWHAWTAHLSQRTKPIPPRDLIAGKAWPPTWNLPEEVGQLGSESLIVQLAALQNKKQVTDFPWQEHLAPWLAEAPTLSPTNSFALENVAVCYSLPRLAPRISVELWWDLTEHLFRTATAAVALELSPEPLVAQILSGELPLALSYLFPEIQPFRLLMRDAHRALSTGLAELLDGEGMLPGEHLEIMRPLLGCWTRCRAIGAVLKNNCWNKDAELQYQWLMPQTLRLARRDGGQMLAGGSAGAKCPGLVTSALTLAGDQGDYAAATVALPSFSKTKMAVNKRAQRNDLPHPANNSEWAGVAILRPDWSKSGERLAVQYNHRTVHLELDCGRDMVLCGEWDIEIRAFGTSLRPTADWEELCWTSDEECDYLELELELESNCRLQRQILLARKDRFLYTADNILCEEPTQIEYRGSLPMGPGITLRPEMETREGYLVGSKPRALVIPLALPEWHIDPRGGSLQAIDGTLELQRRSEGRNLCCPLFLDLHPRRLNKQRTWRQLTVAAQLQNQPHDVAVGYRVQCGREQWLIYRSMAKPANRSVIGQNFSCDCFVGRFTRDGEVEEIVEIEA